MGFYLHVQCTLFIFLTLQGNACQRVEGVCANIYILAFDTIWYLAAIHGNGIIFQGGDVFVRSRNGDNTDGVGTVGIAHIHIDTRTGHRDPVCLKSGLGVVG